MRKELIYLISVFLITSVITVGCTIEDIPFVKIKNIQEEEPSVVEGVDEGIDVSRQGGFKNDAPQPADDPEERENNGCQQVSSEQRLNGAQYKSKMSDIHSELDGYFEFLNAETELPPDDEYFLVEMEITCEEAKYWSALVSERLDEARGLCPPENLVVLHDELVHHYSEVEKVSIEYSELFCYVKELMEVFQGVADRLEKMESSFTSDEVDAFFGMIEELLVAAADMQYKLEHLNPPSDLEEFHQKLVGSLDQTMNTLSSVGQSIFKGDFVKILFALGDFLKYQTEMQAALSNPLNRLVEQTTLIEERQAELRKELQDI